MDDTFKCECPSGFQLAADFRNCTGKNIVLESVSENCVTILSHFLSFTESTDTASSDSGSSTNTGAIAGGIIGVLIAMSVVIAMVLLLFFFYKKNSRSSARKTTKYSRPNDLDSNSSRQNLFSTSPAPPLTTTPSVQFRGQQNHAYSGYKPPTPLYTGA